MKSHLVRDKCHSFNVIVSTTVHAENKRESNSWFPFDEITTCQKIEMQNEKPFSIDQPRLQYSNIDYLVKLKYHIHKKGCEVSKDSKFRIHYMITGD